MAESGNRIFQRRPSRSRRRVLSLVTIKPVTIHRFLPFDLSPDPKLRRSFTLPAALSLSLSLSHATADRSWSTISFYKRQSSCSEIQSNIRLCVRTIAYTANSIRFLCRRRRSRSDSVTVNGWPVRTRVLLFWSAIMAAEAVSSQSWRDSYRGMSSDNIKGLVLALSSSFFIGASFIVKKKGLKKAGASGTRAGL